MLQEIFKRFRREPDFNEFTLQEFIQYLRKAGDEESLKCAEELRAIPKLLALFERATAGRNPTLSEIEQMKMKEIQFQLSLILESQLQTVQALEKLTGELSKSVVIDKQPRSRFDDHRGWDGVIINKPPIGVK